MLCESARAWQDRSRITEGRARMIVLEHETQWWSGNYIILVTWAQNIKGIKYKHSRVARGKSRLFEYLAQ